MQKNSNQTFGEMMKAALLPLQGRDPDEIARRTGFYYDADAARFRFCSLGREISIRWPDCTFDPEIDPWHQLVILHYMDGAQDAPASDQLMPFGAQPGGMVRGGGFERECEEIIRSRIGKCPDACIESACAALGARRIAGNADLCAVFDFLPRYPLTLKIWYADEEMDASGRMFLAAGAERFLGVEDSVTAGTLLLNALQAACK